MSIPLVSLLPFIVLTLVGFLLGLFLAALLWKSNKSKATRAEREIQEKQKEHDRLSAKVTQLESQAA